MEFKCPPDSAVPIIPDVACAERIGQIVRFAYHFSPASSADAPFDAVTAGQVITQKASWIAAMADAAPDDVQLSPPLFDTKLLGSEAKTIGGDDNTTPFGIAIYTGETTPKATFHFDGLTAAQIVALRKLSALAASAKFNVAVFFFTEFNQVLCLNIGTTIAPKYAGIPINNLRLGTLSSEGNNSLTKSESGFNMLPYWDEKKALVTLGFNPYTDL